MPIGLNDEKTVGTVISGTSNTIPHGYLLCNGGVVNRSTYSRLFNVIGVTYGSGDGSTTFNLPDLVGAVPRGAGTSSGYTQNVTVTLGTKTNDANQDHSRGQAAGQIAAGIYNSGGRYADGGFTAWSGLNTAGSNGRTANETRMKNIGMNFFIKF